MMSTPNPTTINAFTIIAFLHFPKIKEKTAEGKLEKGKKKNRNRTDKKIEALVADMIMRPCNSPYSATTPSQAIVHASRKKRGLRFAIRIQT